MKPMTDRKDMTETPRAFHIAGATVPARSIAPGLHVVSTPIGNLGDMTLRGLETLAAAEVIACEDTRISRRLLERYHIRTPLMAYHDHNAATARPKILDRLRAGAAVALISDAGTPLVSDPGFKLVEAARAEGFRVVPAPGPSAILAALVASGLPTDAFFFDGFLPVRAAARRSRLAALAAVPGSLVFFETGPRLAACLADLADMLGPRQAAICRELTKAFETIHAGPLDALGAAMRDAPPPKGEIVLVVAPPLEQPPPGPEAVDDALREALARGSVKDAAAAVATKTGLQRRDLYARALALSAARTR